ncbi:Gti1/Pac2 family-domain-containing protein [Flagelloscypha sp. PMI_526]|nr:Gti1/Pac2 family-domain-containing protein [Flagelloscypha sp. PMI_526]
MTFPQKASPNLPPHFGSGCTHPHIHLRNAHDAQIILEAVRVGVLPLIKRRLSALEREQVQSGCVYVWEETEDEGLYRWTDGRRWSQSRMRGDYLFYEEKVQTTQEERDRKAARRAIRTMNPTVALPPTKRKDRPTKPNGLTKQTYSAIVRPSPGSTEGRKWHVVAYFQGSDYLSFPVVEDYDYLRQLTVPTNMFFGSKTSSRSERGEPPSSEEDSAYASSSYPPSPISPSVSIPAHISSPPKTATYPAASPQPHLGGYLEGYERYPRPELELPPMRGPPDQQRYGGMLPVARVGYIPLSNEDRRALGSLRVVL